MPTLTPTDQQKVEDQTTVTSRSVACDGSGGALGHPRVWLNLGDENRIICPYCSREFILDVDAETAIDH
jgi:uncharacterized Zn-finger protein